MTVCNEPAALPLALGSVNSREAGLFGATRIRQPEIPTRVTTRELLAAPARWRAPWQHDDGHPGRRHHRAA